MARPAEFGPTVTRWTLDGIPGPFVAPWSWKWQRGPEPWVAAIIVPDTRFQGLTNPVELKLECPSRTLSNVTTYTIRNLWVVRHDPLTNGMFRLVLADVRYRLQFAKFTASYNIRSYGGEFRPGTGDNAGLTADVGWKVAGACRDALMKLDANAGGVLIGTPKVRIRSNAGHLIDELLPDNYGNSVGGGWVDAGMEAVQAMLNERGDIVVTPEGGIDIVDRTQKVWQPRWGQFIALDGLPGESEIRWQKPKRAVFGVEQRLGMALKVRQAPTPEGGNVTAPVETLPEQLATLQLECENVVPKPNLSINLLDRSTSPEKLITFDEFYAFAPGDGMNETLLRDRVLAPGNIIDQQNLSGPDRTKATLMDGLARNSYRLDWRIRNDSIRRAFADLQLGRLQADGTTDTSSIQMAFTMVYRHQRVPDDPMSDSLTGNAPWEARWARREELVFRLVNTGLPWHIATVIPGTLEEPVRIPTPADLLDDEFEAATAQTRKLDAAFSMTVYVHGLYVGNLDSFSRDRLHRISRDMFTTGEIPEVQLRMPGITANWQREPASLGDGGDGEAFTLLNDEDLQERADTLLAEVKASYEQDEAGFVTLSGLELLARNALRVEGHIHEATITVGKTGNLYEMQTVVDVRPGMAPFALVASQPAKADRIL